MADEALGELQFGDLKIIYPPTSAMNVSAGNIVRIKGNMDIIQVQDDGMLVTIDNVVCEVPPITESSQ